MTNGSKFLPNRRSVLASGLAVSALPAFGCRRDASPLQTPSERRFDAEIIVLGAGLSGLHAARLLVAEGRDVLVLEGADRIGGRMHTISHNVTDYTEAGGEQVGASYARILDTAVDLGLELIPDNPIRRETTYSYQGKVYGPEDWKTLETHPLSGRFKGGSPSTPLFALSAQTNPLLSPQSWREIQHVEQDISAAQFLKNNGMSGSELQVIGHTLNGNNLESYSIMNLYRSLQLYTQSRDMGGSVSIKGGAQRLPEAMAASLPRAVQTGHQVNSIETFADHVEITDAAGRVFKAKHCICTLPFGALRRVNLKAPVSDDQRRAIKNLPYTQIFQLHFKTETPYWDVDGLPADMWMDGPLERAFINRDRSGKPTQYGRVWINGDGASAVANLTETELSGLLQSEISKMRPVRNKDIRLLSVQNWTSSNALAGGAYMHWAPGQIHQWANIMGQAAGRLSFAGEHLSYLHTGMEGAMESGETAAFALLDV